VATPPRALSGAISSGTLESLLVNRASLPQILVGLVGYGLLWNAVRVAVVLVAASVVGLHVTWAGAPLAVAVLGLMVVAYFAIGLFAASLVLVFRTSGPLVAGVLVVSGLLGGVYYPTSVIPIAWLEKVTAFVPVLYALRPARQLLLAGASAADVADDVLMLSGYAAVLLAAGMLVFVRALRYARSAGTLAQY
jgi:ABC-type polysaccharide/polyol phosphate export permease